MKRVLFLAMNLNSGGAERQMITVAIALKDMGYNVSFVCYETGDFFLDKLESHKIQVSWILRKSALARLLSFRKFIHGIHPDVVISFLETANILNCFAAIGGKKWRVITGERSSIKNHLISKRGRIVAYLLKHYADSLICNSYNAAGMWTEAYPKLQNKIRVIYNISSVRGIPYRDCREDGITRIVVAASYRDIKNTKSVISALSLLSHEEREKIHVDWYGNHRFSGSNYDFCCSLIKQTELEGTISLLSETSSINNEMASADFVGLFSLYEGLPNAICEAMTLGKPIIMTPVSDYDTLVQGNGFLCNGFDAYAICAALRKAIAVSTEDILSMGRTSKRIAELFTEKVVFDNWIKEVDS